MTGFLARRLAVAIPTLLLVSVLVINLVSIAIARRSHEGLVV